MSTNLFDVSINDSHFIRFNDKTEIDEYIISDGITHIESNAFRATRIKKIVIPPSVRFIGNAAFMYSDIKSIDLSKNDGLTMGDSVFENCFKLESATLPEHVLGSCESLFFECCTLKEVVLPKSWEEIPRYFFAGCVKLSEFNLPENLKVINNYAFSKCQSIMNLQLPDTITELGEGCIRDTSIKEIAFPRNLKAIPSYCMAFSENLEKIVFPKVSFAIGEGAFKDCSNLTTVKIPSSTTFIERDAFDCENLKTVLIYGNTEIEAADVFGFRSCYTIHANNDEYFSEIYKHFENVKVVNLQTSLDDLISDKSLKDVNEIMKEVEELNAYERNI